MTRDQRPITIPVTNRNVIIITAFPKKGIVTLSYKGETKTALIEDGSLRKMVNGIDYQKNSFQFFHTVAILFSQLTKK